MCTNILVACVGDNNSTLYNSGFQSYVFYLIVLTGFYAVLQIFRLKIDYYL